MRKCELCGTDYVPRRSWQRTCSRVCGRAFQNTKQRQAAGVKRCRTCQVDLPVASFLVGHPTCVDCEALHARSEKQCTKCWTVKPFASFHKRPDRKLGLGAACKECRAAYSRTLNAHPDKRARNQANKLQYRYGTTPAEYVAMRDAQQGCCAICETQADDTLHVDHCHESGRIRQLLCRQCNALLGNCRDNPAILHRALNYLERHSNGPNLGP